MYPEMGTGVNYYYPNGSMSLFPIAVNSLQWRIQRTGYGGYLSLTSWPVLRRSCFGGLVSVLSEVYPTYQYVQPLARASTLSLGLGPPSPSPTTRGYRHWTVTRTSTWRHAGTDYVNTETELNYQFVVPYADTEVVKRFELLYFNASNTATGVYVESTVRHATIGHVKVCTVSRQWTIGGDGMRRTMLSGETTSQTRYQVNTNGPWNWGRPSDGGTTGDQPDEPTVTITGGTQGLRDFLTALDAATGPTQTELLERGCNFVVSYAAPTATFQHHTKWHKTVTPVSPNYVSKANRWTGPNATHPGPMHEYQDSNATTAGAVTAERTLLGTQPTEAVDFFLSNDYHGTNLRQTTPNPWRPIKAETINERIELTLKRHTETTAAAAIAFYPVSSTPPWFLVAGQARVSGTLVDVNHSLILTDVLGPPGKSGGTWASGSAPVGATDTEGINYDHAPTTETASISTKAGVLVQRSLKPFVTDTDDSAKTALLFEVDALPTYPVTAWRDGEFFELTADGILRWTPPRNWIGSTFITYRVHDGYNYSGLERVNLNSTDPDA